MTTKTTLTHALADGRTVTRTTARDYTHVVVVRDLRNHDPETDLLYLAHAGQHERYHAAVTEAKARYLAHREPGVLSWHGSLALATKAAEAARRNGLTAHVEQINGGEVAA